MKFYLLNWYYLPWYNPSVCVKIEVKIREEQISIWLLYVVCKQRLHFFKNYSNMDDLMILFRNLILVVFSCLYENKANKARNENSWENAIVSFSEEMQEILI